MDDAAVDEEPTRTTFDSCKMPAIAFDLYTQATIRNIIAPETSAVTLELRSVARQSYALLREGVTVCCMTQLHV